MSRLLLAVIIFLMTGCMVGPNFHSPDAPKTKRYTPTPLPAKTISTPTAGKSGKSQYFVTQQSIPADWWVIFHSPEINQLIVTGLANSPTLEASQAALRQAKATLSAQIESTMFPSVTGQFSQQRELFSSDAIGNTVAPETFNLFNAGVNISYTLDVFGGLRRQIEAFHAQVEYQHFLMEGSYLTLTSNIVTTAITIASLRSQIQATEELIKLQKDALHIVNSQFEMGGVTKSDVLSQKSQLEQTRAALYPLKQNLAASYHALAVLVGKLPSQGPLPAIDLDKLNLPTHLPVSLPSWLVRQRPDIRASEALLHAASAQVGVATANLYPQITLTGNYGWTNNALGPLFDPINKVWSFGSQFTQPIFNAGALQSQKRAAIAAFKQAHAQYRQTVLQAFQNVADTLRALEHDAQALNAQKQAEIAAHDSLKITLYQFKLGGVSYLSLLTAERQYLQARINRIKVQAARYTDTAALFQALGGGWWNQDKKSLCCKVDA